MHNKSKVILLSSLLGCCIIIFLTACRKENAKTYTYTLYKPVYISKSKALASINGSPDEPIGTTGKIYIKDKYIFLNDVDKGIHVIDNSNPSRPVQIAFLSIPGNLDISVKGNILYADMYSDLLAIDISNPKKVTVASVLPSLFKNRYFNYSTIDSTEFVAYWIKKDTVIHEGDAYPGYIDCINCSYFYASSAQANASRGPKNGAAGSLAKMVMMNDYLYAITDQGSVGIVSIANAAKPQFVAGMAAGFDLQTIYPFENKLFLGSGSGMFMYDLSDPLNPVTLGQFSHLRSCDPVVTDGDYAYVTLQGGGRCGGANNELDVINIKNLMQPQQIKSYMMKAPTGLCKDGDLLFVCDGTAGVKLFNASNPAELRLLKIIESDSPYDIIAQNKIALIVAKDGLYQYDYKNPSKVQLLSIFSIKR
ncbi:MAG: hypothetical protein ABUT20_21535 [Bacteroidota bacterium]